jgi:glycerol-3-phosphate dehydrogenase
MYDIVVIGAGVVGGMVARTLAKYDLKLCIVDKENDVAMGATKANSAIVHAGFDAKEGSFKARFNVRGSEMMEEVTRELGVKYKRNESLVVAFENEREGVEEIYQRGLKNGVKGIRIVEKDELFALEPNLNPELSCALLATTGAIVCPYELCIAAVGNAMDNGADLKLGFEVTGIEKVWSEADIDVAKREFFTLDGKQVTTMKQHELYIMKITDNNGNVHSVKVIKN